MLLWSNYPSSTQHWSNSVESQWLLVAKLTGRVDDWPPEFNVSSGRLNFTSAPLLKEWTTVRIESFLSSVFQLPVLPVLCIAALWFSTTCLSRLYLGVHTVLVRQFSLINNNNTNVLFIVLFLHIGCLYGVEYHHQQQQQKSNGKK